MPVLSFSSFSLPCAAYTKALQLRPDSVSAQYSRLHYLLHLCDWGGMANLQPHWNTTLQVMLCTLELLCDCASINPTFPPG
jgi:hypothetical protein